MADIVVSKSLDDLDHNARARLFRNGLAVVGFAMVEDFVKSRTGEILERIGSGATPFASLPEGVKRAATMGVLEAIKHYERMAGKSSSLALSFYQEQAKAIASTATTAYQISRLSFANRQSNLSHYDLEEILIAFNVENPWNVLGGIASRCNIGTLDIRSAFERAAVRRHIAAHQASADVEISDLVAFGREVLAIALSFDLIISKALRKLLDADPDYIEKKLRITTRQISLRFLKYDGRYWREYSDSKSRAFVKSEDLSVLKPQALHRARKQRQALILFGKEGFPMQWFTPETD